MLFGLSLVLGLCGCAPRAEVTVDGNNALRLTMQSSTVVETGELLQSLSSLWGGGQLFNETKMGDSFTALGFTNVRARSGDGLVFRLDASATSAAQVLQKDKNDLGKAVSIVPGAFQLLLSPETAAGLMSVMPPETDSYKDLLLAPLFTGETSTEKDYLALIAAVYGQKMADALARSNMVVVFTAPGAITAMESPPWVKTRNTASRTVEWTIPLAALLVRRDENLWRVTW
jgi:hypothetical protein